MQILVYPMYSKQELNADSNYVVYSQLIRQMNVTRPSWQWVVIFPDDKSGYKYTDDGFFSLPNVHRVPMRISPRKISNAVSFDGTWADMMLRKMGFDIIWCNLVEVADKMRLCGASNFEQAGRSVIVAAHNYVIHHTLPYPWHSIEPVAFQQVAGAMFADHNVFNSEWCVQMFRETAGRWIQPEIVDKLIADSTLINYGPLSPGLKPVNTKNKVPVIAYNHRLQGYKNWRETFELLDEIYKEGIKFKVKYLNNTAENTGQITSYPFVEVDLSETHAEYMQKLAGCDLNVTNSDHETFCIAAVESMALGQPFVAPDRITFPEITGRSINGYPFLFHSRDEQKAMLKQLLTDSKLRKEWGEKASKHVMANYTTPLWGERYAALFEKVGNVQLGTPEDVLDHARTELKKVGRMQIRDYYNLIRDVKIGGRIPISNQSFPITKIMRLARAVGGDVRIIKGEQYVLWKDK